MHWPAVVLDQKMTPNIKSKDVIVVIQGFIRHLRSMGYAQATIKSYTMGLMAFGRYLEHRKIDTIRQVTRMTIEDYQLSVMGTSLAPESKALKLRPVKRLFEHLVQSNRLLLNPAAGIVEVTRRRRPIGPVLTHRQIEQLMSQPDMKKPTGIRNRAIMEVLYSTGIRLGELLGLQLLDVDLNDRTILIRRGKGATQRVVPLGQGAARMLATYLKDGRSMHDHGKVVTQALFLTSRGTPLTDGAIRGFLAIYKHRAGIETPVSAHVFRRSCATHFLQNGADIRFVQQLLGHSSLKVTHCYTKVMPIDLKHTHDTTHPGVGDAGN